MKNKGFTLIELLVVVAIIGVLASVVMSSLNSAREKAQNARTVSVLRELHKAITLYEIDHGSYPSDRGSGPCDCHTSGSFISDEYYPRDSLFGLRYGGEAVCIDYQNHLGGGLISVDVYTYDNDCIFTGVRARRCVFHALSLIHI